jgi:acyl dehydratase
MAEPIGCEVLAYNQSTESENKIHDDTVAKQHGFRGGLVPGVTVYAYIVQPAVVAWGMDWLSRGAANVVFRKPVYDGDRVRVEVKNDGLRAYNGEVIRGHAQHTRAAE